MCCAVMDRNKCGTGSLSGEKIVIDSSRGSRWRTEKATGARTNHSFKLWFHSVWKTSGTVQREKGLDRRRASSADASLLISPRASSRA